MGNLTSHLFALQSAIDHARRAREWIVVVAPTDEEKASGIARLLVSMLPADATLCGRTVLIPGGGRVTVVGGTQLLHGDGFQVMFLGFDGKLVPADEIAMHAWKAAAKGVVTLGESPGELRTQ